jgi:large conductance mechanosensitive channel
MPAAQPCAARRSTARPRLPPPPDGPDATREDRLCSASSAGGAGSIGAFLQARINFVIVGFVMFLVVRSYNRFRDTDEPSGPPEDIALLREIRDELRGSRR